MKWRRHYHEADSHISYLIPTRETSFTLSKLCKYNILLFYFTTRETQIYFQKTFEVDWLNFFYSYSLSYRKCVNTIFFFSIFTIRETQINFQKTFKYAMHILLHCIRPSLVNSKNNKQKGFFDKRIKRAIWINPCVLPLAALNYPGVLGVKFQVTKGGKELK